MKPVPSLIPGFNNVSIKKGDTFKISLIEGGEDFLSYDVAVVTGKAELIATDKKYTTDLGFDMVFRDLIFKAEKAGDVEIIVQGTKHPLGSGRYKTAPKSYKLKVQ
jgi:hypothetical protein